MTLASNGAPLDSSSPPEAIVAALAEAREDLAEAEALQRQATEMALSPSVPAGPAGVARGTADDAGFQADRARVRIAMLEGALAAARSRVAREQAEARRRVAAAMRDAVVERFQREYDEAVSALVVLLHLATAAEEACRSSNIPGPGLVDVCALARLPALKNPAHMPLQWPRSAPVPDPACSWPPVFLAATRARGDEMRRIGAQAAQQG